MKQVIKLALLFSVLGLTPAFATSSIVSIPTGTSTTLDFVLDSVTGNKRPLTNLVDPTDGSLITPMKNSGGSLSVLPTTTGGLINFPFTADATDNHTKMIINGAHQVYNISVGSIAPGANWLKLYNAGTGFNGCNSATNLVYHMVIPAQTTGAGFVVNIPMGISFSSGISACVVGGYAQNDASNATANAITVNIGYK